MLNLARRATSPPMSLGFSCAGARHPCEDLKKWYEVPIASRVQPVVASGRLFIGSMDGVMYARDASTGAPLWSFSSQGPIRNSAGVLNDMVMFSSHDGYTYALDAATGALKWKALTGGSSTAPLMDAARGRVYVVSSDYHSGKYFTSSDSGDWNEVGRPTLQVLWGN
jgi:outer membrane protein assembly factor BamB